MPIPLSISTTTATAPSPTARRVGIAYALLSGVGFGFLGVLGKFAYDAGFSAGEHLAMRFLVAGGSLWAYLLLFDRQALCLPLRSLLACLGLGTCGYAVFSMTYFAALDRLSASLTVMLLYTYPVLVVLGAWLLFRQNSFAGDRRKVVSLPLVCLGLVLLVAGDLTVGSTTGILFGLASALLYTLYILVSSRLLYNINPLVSVCYIQTAAGLTLAAIYLRDPARVATLIESSWPLVVATALLCTVGPMVLFLRSLQRISPAEVSMLSTAEPLTGVIAASLILDERLSKLQIVGAATIIAALIYMAKPAPVVAPPQRLRGL